MRLIFTSEGVGVAIRSVELYDLEKTAFWFRLRFHRLRSSENRVVGVASRSGRTKPITKRGNVHRDWFILPLLLPTLIPSPLWLHLPHPLLMFSKSYALLRLRLRLQPMPDSITSEYIFFFQCVIEGCYLNGERGAAGERAWGTGKWKIGNKT